MLILKEQPYLDLKITIEESNVIQPSKERFRKFLDTQKDSSCLVNEGERTYMAVLID